MARRNAHSIFVATFLENSPPYYRHVDYKSDKEESREDVLTQEEREIREDHKIAEEEKSMSPETLSVSSLISLKSMSRLTAHA